MVNISRRKALGLSVALVAGAFVSAECDTTPQQVEGPFYPENLGQEKDNDLTWLKGKKSPAKGEVVYVFGVVRDNNCHVLKNAIVEIWQACASGRYNHSVDESESELDENFQYWGRCITDKEGRYSFKTIKPGTYSVNSKWRRPPHIHFKVAKRGYTELTTQMYFSGETLNQEDRLLQKLSKKQKKSVTVELQKPDNKYDYSKISDFNSIESTSKICYFDVVLEEVV